MALKHGKRHASPDLDVAEVIDGIVDRVSYVNEEDGWTVARLKVPRRRQLLTIAGFLPAITVGEGLRVEGEWVDHPQYGRQFSVSRYQSAAPGTLAALKRYLGSGLLKGVGPVLAEHIANSFGLETLQVLDANPERLAEVPGLGARKAAAIAEAWHERRALKDLMVFLQGVGLPVALAVRILKKYGTAAEAVVRENPYRLAAEVYGISFKVADGIAAQGGVAHESPQRLGAGLRDVLQKATQEGHTFLPTSQAISGAARLLNVPSDTVQQALPAIRDLGHISLDTVAVNGHGPEPVAYLPELHAAETGAASTLKSIVAARSRLEEFARLEWPTAWRYLAGRDTVRLTSEQEEAIRAAFLHRVAVITGGPGTGKTTTLRSIVRLMHARKRRVALAAPTGRAAKRLTEATGVEAVTIHRLLELRPGGGFEVRAPLDAEMIIVDEASMMDVLLADALLRAVPHGAHLVLVGDADQLPPVGPGAFLRDVIASSAVSVTRLETIFRQPEGSAIVSNAHLINAGQRPVYGKEIKDFFFFREASPAACASLIVDLATRRVPQKFGLDRLEDIQVLAPVYAGVCGIEALNANLQATLNPPASHKDERRFGTRIFRVGDKVMQLANDYDRQVSNGELGRITRIDLEEQTVHVRFDAELTVEYGFPELDELTHAFAISVHKAQGSEYAAVIMPVLPQHGRLLQRNLLYTAVSRARGLVVLVGSPEALAQAAATDTATRRFSGLVQRLRSELPSAPG